MTERLITHLGKTQSLTRWAEEIGLHHSSLSERLEKMPVDQALSPIQSEPDDPHSLASLALGINVSALKRFEANMSDVHAWIDEKSKSDPERAAKLLEKLATIYDRFAKYTPQQQRQERAFVNISLNTEARPETIEVRGRVVE